MTRNALKLPGACVGCSGCYLGGSSATKYARDGAKGREGRSCGFGRDAASVGRCDHCMPGTGQN